jgi:hypothetical protein
MLDTSKITTEQYVLGAIAGFLMLFAIGTCGGSGGGSKDPQALAKKVVEAIAKNDRKAADRLLLTTEQTKEVMESSDMPADVIAKGVASIELQAAEAKADFDVRWASLYTRMNLDGFDPAQMKIVAVDAVEEARQGITGAEIKVDVESAGKPGMILFTGIKHKAWHLIPRVYYEAKSAMPAH